MGKMLVKYPESFAGKVLEEFKISGHGPVVIEGVRHVQIWNSLREILGPIEAHLLYLDVPQAEIRRRLRSEDLPEAEIEALEKDETETDLLRSRWRTRFSAIWLGKEIVIC
jgi:hypothetical protein